MYWQEPHLNLTSHLPHTAINSTKEYYNSVKNRKGSWKYTHVSTMRKLIRMIYTMLRERREWKYENTALTESKFSRLDDN